MSTVLKIDHLTKRFGGLCAVNDLSLEMKGRTIHALIGPNGSGKSTTINMVTGSFPSTSGHVYHGDIEITNKPPYEISATGINRTYQNLKLYPSLTVKENLMVGMQSKTTQNFASFIVNPFRAAREERMIEERGISAVSLAGAFRLLCGVIRHKRYDLLNQFLMDEGAWLRMLREGATVTFEAWGKDLKWNTSLFHLTFSYVMMFLADVDIETILK